MRAIRFFVAWELLIALEQMGKERAAREADPA